MRNFHFWGHIYFQLEQYIWGNGNMEKDMVKDNKNGLMVQFMRDFGKMEWHQVKVD